VLLDNFLELVLSNALIGDVKRENPDLGPFIETDLG
jgi:hypothetical protein